jgi:hypothetical protein
MPPYLLLEGNESAKSASKSMVHIPHICFPSEHSSSAIDQAGIPAKCPWGCGDVLFEVLQYFDCSALQIHSGAEAASLDSGREKVTKQNDSIQNGAYPMAVKLLEIGRFKVVDQLILGCVQM